ncbi:MAG: oligoendopeptidase F [Clostridia bacterium]|jgi:oligoendopeptidase F|nr:oligoendopeptidase F [Clostridia bacterium]
MKREQVQEKYKWNTADIFPTDEAWEKEFEKAEKTLSFSQYSGKLGDKNTLLKFLREFEDYQRLLERLYVYAHMRHDEDAGNAKYGAYYSKAGMLASKFATELSFYEPEMAKLDESYLKSLINDKEFADYDYDLKRTIARKPHVVSEAEERLIGMSGEILDGFYQNFSMIDNLDLPLPEIEWEGEKTALSHGLYGIILHSDNREKRKECYEKYYAAYTGLINTLTSVYNGNVKKDVFLSKVYKFGSCLERALFSEDVDKKVYDNLLSAVNKNLPSMHRYIADRKKILGYDKQYFYDIYAPLVDGVNVKYTYDEAYELVINGLAPLGKEYQALLKKGYDERWIDVEETEGKRNGAYSIGCPDCHPFVLLNYQPTLHEVFTIAHEMGHALHTYFSQKNQPYAKSEYKIFVAEVASTVNETLLLKHMLKEAKDINLRKYLLNYYLDSMRATLHRQTMFAEFEAEAHAMAEREEPLTKEALCNLYADIGKKYYGDKIEHDYNISCEWARIPHFYSAFYVYKYATGITAAINIAARILSEGENAVKDYFKFLSGGGSTDPVSLLKLAGVDLSTTAPFEVAMREFDETLTEFEKLMNI